MDTFRHIFGVSKEEALCNGLTAYAPPQGTTHPWQQSQNSWQDQLVIPEEATRGRQESAIPYPLPVATLDSCRFDIVSQRQRIRHYWTLLDTFLGFPRRKPYVTALPPMPHPQGTTHPWQQSQNSWQGQLVVPKVERHPVLDTGRESRDPHLHSRVRRNGAVLR